MAKRIEFLRKNLQAFGDSTGVVLPSKWIKDYLKLGAGEEIALALVEAKKNVFEIRLRKPK